MSGIPKPGHGEGQHDHLPGQAQAGPGRGDPPPAQHARQRDQRPPCGEGEGRRQRLPHHGEDRYGRREQERSRHGPHRARRQQQRPGHGQHRRGVPLVLLPQQPGEPLAGAGHDQVDRLARFGPAPAVRGSRQRHPEHVVRVDRPVGLRIPGQQPPVPALQRLRRWLAPRAPVRARRVLAAAHIVPSAGRGWRSRRSRAAAASALRRIRSVSAASRATPASVSA